MKLFFEKYLLIFILHSCPFSFAQNPIDRLTLNSFCLGIKEIKTNQNEYSFITFKKSFINATSIDAKNFKIRHSGNTYSLTDDLNPEVSNKYTISLDSHNSISQIVTPYYSGRMELNEELLNDYHFVFLYLFISELYTDPQTEKLSYDSFTVFSQRLGCSFWNTYYSVGIGASDAGALAHLNHTANNALHSGDLNGCTLLSTKPEFSSHFGVHIASIAWCCP